MVSREAAQVLERVAAAGWRWLIPGDPGYPPLINEIADPPLGLFVRGTLSDAPVAAVVGSRRPTAYGLQVAYLLGEELARNGVIVVSGMARGIDSQAHEGVLKADGTTWAVWGCGPDRIYPPEHGRLAERIAERGALLTEYPPGTPPRRHHFPERNRLIAGLAQAVVVVEAAARSGALVTARQALDEGREVLAVPGSIFSEVSIGPNALLRLGAAPMLTPRDVLNALEITPETTSLYSQDNGDDPVLAAFDGGNALTTDEVAKALDAPVSEVAGLLLEHEIAGRIVLQPDGRYRLTTAPTPRNERKS
jgi:DNA processing protein